jgi:hypothetical protein
MRIAAAAACLVLVAAISTAAIATALSTRDDRAATGPQTAVTVLAPGEEIALPGDEALDPDSSSAADPGPADFDNPDDGAAADPEAAADPADPDNPAADPDPAADSPAVGPVAPDPEASDTQDADTLPLMDTPGSSGTSAPSASEQLADQLTELVAEKREEKVKTQTEYGDIESMLAYVTENGTQEEIDRYTRLLDEYAQKLTKLDEDIERYTQ